MSCWTVFSLSSISNGLVNIASAVSSIVSTLSFSNPNDCMAPAAVAGRLVSLDEGRTKSREMAGSASVEENEVPVADPPVELNDEAEENE